MTTEGESPTISDAAVEAAAKAVTEATEAWEYPLWGEGAETVARAALEAAARHLTEGAWDDGYGHGYKHGKDDCMRLMPGPA
jgi:hypothetical protein